MRKTRQDSWRPAFRARNLLASISVLGWLSRAHPIAHAAMMVAFNCERPTREPTMARISARESEGALAGRATAAPVHGVQSHPFKYVPGFVYILVLFIAGKLIFPDPRAVLVQWNGYHLSADDLDRSGAALSRDWSKMSLLGSVSRKWRLSEMSPIV